jgi:hypothetical protein
MASKSLTNSGKSKVVRVAVAIFIFEMLSQLAAAGSGNHSSSDVVRLVLTLALLHFLIQGKNWARWLVMGLFGLTALAGIVLMLVPADPFMKVFGVLLLLFSAAVIYVLRLPDVQSFFSPKKK